MAVLESMLRAKRTLIRDGDSWRVEHRPELSRMQVTPLSDEESAELNAEISREGTVEITDDFFERMGTLIARDIKLRTYVSSTENTNYPLQHQADELDADIVMITKERVRRRNNLYEVRQTADFYRFKKRG